MNHDYFNSIDSSDKAYWLGFLSADGCVTANKRHRVIFGLHSDDEAHLQTFLDAIEATDVNILHRSNQPFSYVQISSEPMVTDLMSHGCNPHKSLHLKFPTHILNIYTKDFIRGYFDGDGSVYKNKGSVACKFLGNHDFLLHLKNYLQQYGCSNRPVEHTQAGNIWHLRYQRKEDIRALYMLLYMGAKTWLPRKKTKFGFGG